MGNQRLFSDGTKPKKYFTILPNIIYDLEMSSDAFCLYSHLMRLSSMRSADISCRALADACNMSRSSISRAKKELVDAGLIRIEKRASGRGMPYDEIHLVDISRRNEEYYQKPADDLVSPNMGLTSPSMDLASPNTRLASPTGGPPYKKQENKKTRNGNQFSFSDDCEALECMDDSDDSLETSSDDDSEDLLGPLEKPDYYIMDDHPSEGPIIDVVKREADYKRNGINPYGPFYKSGE